MKKNSKILLIALLIPTVIFGQIDSVEIHEDSRNENIMVGDIGGQLLAGSVGGGLISLVGAGIVVGLASINNSDSEALDYGILGLVVGYTIGNALGIYIAADKNKYDVNILYLFISSAASMGIGLWLHNVSGQTGFLIAAPLVLPPLLTVATLNVFNRKENNLEVGVGVNKIPNTNKQYCAFQFKHSF